MKLTRLTYLSISIGLFSIHATFAQNNTISLNQWNEEVNQYSNISSYTENSNFAPQMQMDPSIVEGVEEALGFKAFRQALEAHPTAERLVAQREGERVAIQPKGSIKDETEIATLQSDISDEVIDQEIIEAQEAKGARIAEKMTKESETTECFSEIIFLIKKARNARDEWHEKQEWFTELSEKTTDLSKKNKLMQVAGDYRIASEQAELSILFLEKKREHLEHQLFSMRTTMPSWYDKKITLTEQKEREDQDFLTAASQELEKSKGIWRELDAQIRNDEEAKRVLKEVSELKIQLEKEVAEAAELAAATRASSLTAAEKEKAITQLATMSDRVAKIVNFKNKKSIKVAEAALALDELEEARAAKNNNIIKNLTTFENGPEVAAFRKAESDELVSKKIKNQHDKKLLDDRKAALKQIRYNRQQVEAARRTVIEKAKLTQETHAVKENFITQRKQISKEIVETVELDNDIGRASRVLQATKKNDLLRAHQEKVIAQTATIYEQNDQIASAAKDAYAKAEAAPFGKTEYKLLWNKAIQLAQKTITAWEQTVVNLELAIGSSSEENQSSWKRELPWITQEKAHWLTKPKEWASQQAEKTAYGKIAQLSKSAARIAASKGRAARVARGVVVVDETRAAKNALLNKTKKENQALFQTDEAFGSLERTKALKVLETTQKATERKNAATCNSSGQIAAWYWDKSTEYSKDTLMYWIKAKEFKNEDDVEITSLYHKIADLYQAAAEECSKIAQDYDYGNQEAQSYHDLEGTFAASAEQLSHAVESLEKVNQAQLIKTEVSEKIANLYTQSAKLYQASAEIHFKAAQSNKNVAKDGARLYAIDDTLTLSAEQLSHSASFLGKAYQVKLSNEVGNEVVALLYTKSAEYYETSAAEYLKAFDAQHEEQEAVRSKYMAYSLASSAEQLAYAAESLEEATKAIIAGHQEVASFYTQSSNRYKGSAEEYIKAKQAYDSWDQEKGDRSEDAAKSLASSAEQLAHAAEAIEAATGATIEGHQEIASLYTQSAEQYQNAAEEHLKSNQSYLSENEKESELIDHTAEALELSANQLLSAAESLEVAARATRKGHSEIAHLYAHNSECHQYAAQGYLKAIEFFKTLDNGNEDDIDYDLQDEVDYDTLTDLISSSVEQISNADDSLEEAANARTQGKLDIASYYGQNTECYQMIAKEYLKAAQSYISENGDDDKYEGNVLDSLSFSVDQLSNADEAIDKVNQARLIKADNQIITLYIQSAGRYQAAAKEHIKAVQSYIEKNNEKGDQLSHAADLLGDDEEKSSAYCLSQAAEYLSRAAEVNDCTDPVDRISAEIESFKKIAEQYQAAEKLYYQAAESYEQGNVKDGEKLRALGDNITDFLE